MARLRFLLIALLIAGGCGAGKPPGEPPPELKLVEVVKTPEPGVLDHVGRRFTLRYPPSWKAVRAVEGGRVVYYVTPGKEIRPRRMEVALKVGLSTIPRASVLQGKDAISLLNHWLPAIRGRYPGLVPDSEVRKAALGTLPAAAITARGPLRYHQGQFRMELYMAAQDDEQFYTWAFAPEDDFDEYADAFRQIVSESRFGRTSPPRQPM